MEVFTPETDGTYKAVVINVFSPASIWADFYSGPSAINIILVAAVIIGLWLGAVMLDLVMRKKFAHIRTRQYDNLEE